LPIREEGCKRKASNDPQYVSGISVKKKFVKAGRTLKETGPESCPPNLPQVLFIVN